MWEGGIRSRNRGGGEVELRTGPAQVYRQFVEDGKPGLGGEMGVEMIGGCGILRGSWRSGKRAL